MAQIESRDVISALLGLKNDARLAIYCGLVRSGAGGMTPTRLSLELGIAPSTLSFHLKELSHCSLITATQKGRKITYCANPERMGSVVDFLIQHCS